MVNIAFAIPGFSTDPRSAEGREVRSVIHWCSKSVGSHKFLPGAVAFSIDKAFRPRSSNIANAAALETLLDALTALDQIWLKYHRHTPLYYTQVFYARTIVWDTIPALYGRGFGDCKSLSACRVAEMRSQGIWCRPCFRHKSTVSSTMFHILVMYSDGSWEDPSKALGMLSYQEDPAAPNVMHHSSPLLGHQRSPFAGDFPSGFG